MIAYWGGSAITQRSHLALLRDVSQLSNPRWRRPDHHFGAGENPQLLQRQGCLLIMQDKGTDMVAAQRAANGNGRRAYQFAPQR